MTYNRNVPASGDSLAETRDPIRTNFQLIQDNFEINHEAYDTADVGKHKFLQLPEQSSAPATAANEGGFYAAEANSVTQLFYRRESNGTTLQMTAADVTDTTAQATSGYSCLPGGLLIQWGSFGSEDNAATRAVTFPKAFSASPYSITVTPTKAGTVSSVDVYVQSPATTGFTIRHGDGHSWDYFWMAIGIA